MRKYAMKRQAEAYFLVFEDIYNDDGFLNKDIKYIAVDLANIILESSLELTELLQAFCENKGYILLQESFESLKEKGYMKGHLLHFEEGILISFKDKELKAERLYTSCEKWRDGRAARGADYMIERSGDEWQLIRKDNLWVS